MSTEKYRKSWNPGIARSTPKPQYDATMLPQPIHNPNRVWAALQHTPLSQLGFRRAWLIQNSTSVNSPANQSIKMKSISLAWYCDRVQLPLNSPSKALLGDPKQLLLSRDTAPNRMKITCRAGDDFGSWRCVIVDVFCDMWNLETIHAMLCFCFPLESAMEDGYSFLHQSRKKSTTSNMRNFWGGWKDEWHGRGVRCPAAIPQI